MRSALSAGLCLFSLLLTGCNLDIDIVGKGHVYSTDQTIDCIADCRYSSYNGIKEVQLRGEADPGYRFLGLLSDEIYTSMATSARIEYGLTFSNPNPDNLAFRPLISNQVTALFYPEDDLVKAAGTQLATCVLTQSSTLKCWGPHTARYNQLQNVTGLFASNYLLCIEHDGRMQCWDDFHGVEWTVPDFITNVQQVAFGFSNLCVQYETNAGNQIHCINQDGLADPVVPEMQQPTALRSGFEIFCAEDQGDTICWGTNYYGQSHVPANLGPVTAFAAGDHHTCAITAAGVRCWGGNEFSQSEPPLDLVAPTAITAGLDHTCVYDSGEIRCWGANPLRMSLTGSDFNPALFNSHDNYMCVIDPVLPSQPMCYSKGEAVIAATLPGPVSAMAVAVGFNANSIGAITGNLLYIWSPGYTTLAPPIELDQPYLLAGAEGSFCVGEQDATWTRCWGTSTSNTNTPAELTHPQSLSMANYHGCAVQDGIVLCWGNSTTSRNRGQMSVPAGLPPITTVDTGRFHSCALGENQQLYCWGEKPLPIP